MVPISAAMAAPIRPATTTPVRMGDSSRPMAMATMPPTESAAPKRTNSLAVWTDMTMPVHRMVMLTMGRESAPSRAICRRTSRRSAVPAARQASRNRFTTRPVRAHRSTIFRPTQRQISWHPMETAPFPL